MNTEVSVREMMNREYVGASESDDLVETVELLLQVGAEAAVVLRGSEPVGVVTQRDVLALLVDGPDPETATVGDAMSENLPTIGPDASIEAAADRMSAQSSRRLVVTDGTEPLGLVTEHDLVAARTYDPGARQPETAGSPAASEASMTAETGTDPEFDEQGICEVCGTLSESLTPSNGQLLCGDCRDISATQE